MVLGWYNISIRLLMANLGGDSALDQEEKQNLILEVT